MYYVVRVGDYYIKSFDSSNYDVTLSKEVMRSFTKEQAETLAIKLRGEVIEMAEEVTYDEEDT